MRKIYSGRFNNTEPFKFRVDNKVSGPATSPAGTFVLPISSGTSSYGNIAFHIDWGDGTSSNLNSSNFATAREHVYPDNAVRDVTITGNIRGWSFAAMSSGSNDDVKIEWIEQWGDFRVTESSAFEGCANMVYAGFYDTPIFENPLSGSKMFKDCVALKLVGNIKLWNVSKLTNMLDMFRNCNAFNEGLYPSGGIDISPWDVSNVTNMAQMFYCDASQGTFNGLMFTLTNTTTVISNMFRNQPVFNNGNDGVAINSWDTSNCSTFSNTFRDAAAFNRDISGWDTANCSTFNNMFRGSSSAVMAFNQPIGAWDTSSGNSFTEMFTFCNSFQQSLSNWDLSGVLTGTPIADNSGGGNFNIGLNNYNNLLLAWDAYTYPSWFGSTFNFGASQYSSNYPAAVAAHANLVIKWGGIIDGGSTP
jgi:hypothetical protein